MDNTTQTNLPETNLSAETPGDNSTQSSRRGFLGHVLAATSGLALTGLLGEEDVLAQAACAPAGEELEMFQVSRGSDGILKSILQMSNELRQIPAAGNPATCAGPVQFRCFKVVDANGAVIWPKTPGVPRPGPIYSVEVGDTMELTFVNHVDEKQVSGSVDFGDPVKKQVKDPVTGKMVTVPEHPQWGCDTAQNSSGQTTVPFQDNYPDCFHGSNAANMHFHGTHVTPEGFGDNVLVQVQPDLGVSVKQAVTSFQPIYDKVNGGNYTHGHVDWEQAIPKDWKTLQTVRLMKYDDSHQFQGKKLKDWGLSLLKKNQDAIAKKEWPPYQMGAFPYSFKVTKYDPANPDGPEMGQAPGTHWYHAHKHGSTTMHLLHGLAGAFIIRGQYDKELQAFYNNKLTEKVMILQEFAPTPNLYAPGRPRRSILVNGQLQPKITMGEGEVQLWRIINGAMEGPATLVFPAPLTVRQIAQDGVQFRAENFQRLQNTNTFVLSPGNRIDLLVQANGAATVTNNGANIVSVAISGANAMPLPTAANYPVTKLPFLDDIDPASVRMSRRVTFSWEDGRQGTGRDAAGNPPHFLIDGKQFEENIIYQSMSLNRAEEWKVENGTTIVHPFHIHVNPFQVFEVMDPNTKDASGNPVITAASYPLFQNPTPANQAQRDALLAKCMAPIQAPFIWWDTLQIPTALVDSTGKLVLTKPGGPAALPGHFRMRSRFTDFTGKFVLHCHILGHEDRGMMQLVEVSDRKTSAAHH